MYYGIKPCEEDIVSRFSDFEQYIEDAMPTWQCPGTAISIVKGDEDLHQSVHGLRDIENKLPVTVDTRFAMASVTKSFTAMSVALLVDEGKLEWDKPVRDYMPEFILDDPYVTQHVTVRDMLSHRTGLPRHDFSAWRLDIPRSEFVKRMRHFKFSATFREKFQYNNLMYYVIPYLVEKLTNQKWEEFMQARIFKPLGMTATNFKPEPPIEGQINALGYRVERDNEGNVKELVKTPFGLHTDLSPGAAGALFSTLADLTQWLKVHVNDGKANDFQLVSADNLKQMHLPHTIIPGGGFNEALMGNTIFTYGMGWFIEPYRGYTLIHHGGNVEGHSLIIGFVPQEKVGVVILTNIGMLPLRDVLLYESIDRALDLSDRGWNRKFHEIMDPLIIGEAKAKQTAAEEKVEDAPPTHSMETYIGAYEAEGYPEFAIRKNGDGYQACTVGSLDWSELRHYHYNVFEWHWEDFDTWVKVRFQVNENGEVDSVSIPIEPEVDDVVFKRKQPELTKDVIAAIVGEYIPPVEGIIITVAIKEGKIYIAQTGGSYEEMKPYKISDDMICFKIKRNRIDILLDKGTAQKLIYKEPFMTLEAPRKI